MTNKAWTNRQNANSRASLSRWLRRSSRATVICLITLLGAAVFGPLFAQHQVSTFFPAGADARAAIYGPLLDAGTGAALDQAMMEEGRNPVALAAGGVLGGAVGLMAGGLVGGLIGERACSYPFSVNDSCEGRFFTALALGAVLGEVTLLPLGVHIADRRRGSYALMTSRVARDRRGRLGSRCDRRPR